MTTPQTPQPPKPYKPYTGAAAADVPAGSVIQADFEPAAELQRLKKIAQGLGVLLGLTLVVSLVVYGVLVQSKTTLNVMGSQARSLNEENKVLQVQLDRIQSFKNLETQAQKVPNLALPKETLEITVDGSQRKTLPPLPQESGVRPHVSGY